LSYFDQEKGERVVPYVIEPSAGLERLIFTILLDSYYEKSEKDEIKTVLKLNPTIAPVKVGVFPLMKKDGLKEKAREVYEMLNNYFVCEYDDAGSIGKRYARADEIGTPFAVTIDYQTLQDSTVTLRDRDSASQVRVHISELVKTIRKALNLSSGEIS
jgi:glycyl-tRNA synthetase